MIDTRAERADTIREQMRNDIIVTLRQYGIQPHGLNDSMYDAMVEELVGDGMFHVEHLLVELTT